MRVQAAFALVWVLGCASETQSPAPGADAGNVLTPQDAALPPHDAAIVADAGRAHDASPNDGRHDATLPATDARVGVQLDAAIQVPEPSGALVSEFMTDTGDGWFTLIDARWVLPAGQETHLLARLNVTREAYLHEFSPLSPQGTHHAVLNLVDDQSQPESVELGTSIAGQQLYGAGVGTNDTVLPDGVAARVRPGQQLVLDLHLFNATEHVLEGVSGVRVKIMAKEDVEHEAEGVLAGPISLDIPLGSSVQRGTCTLSADSTIFSVSPHMHQLGVHLRSVAHSSVAGDVVLYDGPYMFESQQRYPISFVQMKAGDVIDIECTYQNDTERRVSWGQSSLDEMCFIGLGRYPVQDPPTYLCTN